MKDLLVKYNNKLFYLEGDPLKQVDLNRCQFKQANTILILCNKQTDDPSSEDSKTILLAMTIRKFFNSDNNKEYTFFDDKQVNKHSKILIQLLKPESELHFSLSISRNKNLDQILCIDEIKLSLLAKSCICQGIISLMSNLITTSNLEYNETMFEQNKWLEEYSKGKGYEIYQVKLENFRGEKFSELVINIYNEKGVILFGINIECKDESNNLVLLNPGDFIIPYADDINVHGYLFAMDKTTADDIVKWNNKKSVNQTKSEIKEAKRVRNIII